MSFTPEQIAQVCFEANRGLQRLLGEQVNFPWESTSPAIQNSTINGVVQILDGKVTEPSESHENWYQYKLAEGWGLGPVKDFASKEHPDMVPWDELPPEQRLKDELFFVITTTMAVSE